MNTAIAAVTTSVLSLFGIMVQDWLGRRSRRERQKRLFDDASWRVSFATAWWSAMESLSSQPDELTEARTRSLQWLHEASTLVTEAKQLPIAERTHLSPSRVLLTYHFKRRSANVIRLCFYLVLSFAIIYAAIIPSDRRNGFFVSDFVGLAVCVLGALLLRAWAVTVEKHSPNEKRSPHPVQWPTWPGPGS
jgi:hypothetical protein